jgi:2-C-methyl-D-erythritol 2,4-cyclodiphosphate synthase
VPTFTKNPDHSGSSHAPFGINQARCKGPEVTVYRIGTGWDRHPLVADQTCVLGGVVFPASPVGPTGHSDGDAVCHAVIDAVLGAANLGDIGRHFPDSDPTWAGADSLDLLRRSVAKLHDAGYRVVNVDCTVITEQPVIAPHAADMAARMAEVLATEASAISVKATRGEKLGPEGRGECLTVVAVALIAAVKP